MHQPVTGVARPDRLGGEARGAGPEEIAERIDEGEDQRAKHQPAQQGRIAQPPDDRDVVEAGQRLGDEGDGGGQRNAPHIGRPHFEWIGCARHGQPETQRPLQVCKPRRNG
jgi:hypothetical protein